MFHFYCRKSFFRIGCCLCQSSSHTNDPLMRHKTCQILVAKLKDILKYCNVCDCYGVTLESFWKNYQSVNRIENQIKTIVL